MNPKKDAAPVVVKRGNVQVKIYTTKNRSSLLYTVAYIDLKGARQRINFKCPKKARTEAERIATELHNGEHELLTLSHGDAALYNRALKKLAPTGLALDTAIAAYVEASQVLTNGASLMEAARYYMRHHTEVIPAKRVSDILTEFLASKEADNHSSRHIQDCRSRLTRFSNAFPDAKIADLGHAEMQKWLEGLSLAPRSRNNFRNIIVGFFHYSQNRGYLSKSEHTEASLLTKAREAEGDIGFLTPQNLARLLEKAQPRLIPYIAIAAFAGLRRAEIQRLDWSEVTEEMVRIHPKKSKTRQRRAVPIQPNLAAWLAPHRKSEGPVCPTGKIPEYVTALADSLQIEWPNNALRHSYASYRLASCQDAPKVALEMSNTPDMIFRHYRQLVTPKEAEKWWGAYPQSSPSVS